MKWVILVATIVIMNGISTIPALANDAATNNVSGVIYHDSNDNGMQDLNEIAIPNAIVNVRELESDLIESLIVDGNGNFNTGELVYGSYVVWSEVNGQMSAPVNVEVNELSANSVISLGISHIVNSVNHVEPEMTQIQTVLLPIVMN